MVLAEALACLGLDPSDAEAERLYGALVESAADSGAPSDWLILASALARSVTARARSVTREHRSSDPMPWPAWNHVSPPLVLGISGGQGAGKTTLARLLTRALELAGARAQSCSLDDFYLTRARRLELARTIHPLLATRGVPGTHDVDLLRRTIAVLGRGGTVALPVFDKAADDRLPRKSWRRCEAPVDVLVLEGWCLGARAQPESTLRDPVNDLEAREDEDGVWRRSVNAVLRREYEPLWAAVHLLIYLEVPDMAAVLRWRTAQEQALPAEQRMSTAGLQRFVAHYQRITGAIRADLPQRAHLTVRLNERHRVVEIRRNAAP